jgi:hypothetical protein
MLPKKQNLSRLNIFYKRSYKNIKNKFYSKALCYKAVFNERKFYNVNFKGAILSTCSFKKATFTNVEFLGTNLKKSNFTNAKFKDCTFSATLMKDTNFKNAEFENCIFVNTNTQKAKNLKIDSSKNILLSGHKLPEIDYELLELFNTLKFHPKLHNTRVLHLKSGKLNSLTLYILLSTMSQEECKRKLYSLESKLNTPVITAYQLSKILQD